MDAGLGEDGGTADSGLMDADGVDGAEDGGGAEDSGGPADGGLFDAGPSGPAGHVVLIGMWYNDSSLNEDRIVAQSVLLTSRPGPIDILQYDAYASTLPTGHPARIRSAISTYLGVISRAHTFRSGDPTPTNLATADVFIVYFQDRLDGATRMPWITTTAPSWNTALNDFVDDGGVVIACDGWGAGYQAVVGPGFFNIPIHTALDFTAVLEVVRPSDPIVAGVSTFYSPRGDMLRFPGATGGDVVVEADGSPHVLHITRPLP
jgi:hypothetical protein